VPFGRDARCVLDVVRSCHYAPALGVIPGRSAGSRRRCGRNSCPSDTGTLRVITSRAVRARPHPRAWYGLSPRSSALLPPFIEAKPPRIATTSTLWSPQQSGSGVRLCVRISRPGSPSRRRPAAPDPRLRIVLDRGRCDRSGGASRAALERPVLGRGCRSVGMFGRRLQGSVSPTGGPVSPGPAPSSPAGTVSVPQLCARAPIGRPR
jgi:hypothetical protein